MNNKIAIIAWGAMADVLYATPIVRHIRSLHPEAHIVWLVRDKFADVIRGNPDINEVRTFKLPNGFTNRQDAEYKMDREILDYAMLSGEFVKYYDLQYWPRYANFYEYLMEDFISLRARNAGLNPTDIKDRRIELRWSRDDEAAVSMWLLNHNLLGKKFITVNHISYAASPVWSFENYEKLVSLLDVPCVFTGAPNEPLPEGAIDARGMPYCQWAALIHSSSLWLGLDSGAVALAAASDTPIIKLHSPDFPIVKTGIRAMGLRKSDVLELSPAPTPESLSSIILENMK